MTKKDYELLVKVIANRRKASERDQHVMDCFVVDLAEALVKDNSRFDALRFIEATKK